MLYAVVMAGGSGTRFWPMSRRNRPKQLLRLFGDRTMIQTTVDRIAPLVPPERILVVTGAGHAAGIRTQLPELPADAVVSEPCPRDTAACVGLAAAIVAHRDPDGTMLVLSADHFIEPAAAFQRTLRAAVVVVESDPSTFVTLGVRPTHPATGYGYIEQGAERGRPGGIVCRQVVRFQEKPDRHTAERFLAAGNFVWNAGIFIWKARAVLDALARFQPELAAGIHRIAATLGQPDHADTLAREFPTLTRLPIDRAVMEQYPNVAVLDIDYMWSDVGDWRSLSELLPQDDAGNASRGPVHHVGSRGTTAIADEGRPIVTLGLDDVVIVQSGGVTLVARKDQLDRLKDLVAGLPDAGLGDVL